MKLPPLLLLLALGAWPLPAATPPSRPANPINRDGFWVGQSEPGTPCYTTIDLFAEHEGETMKVRGDVTVEPKTGIRPRVVALWISPTGERWKQNELADAAGIVHFHCQGPRGEYRLRILEVLKVRYRYDPEAGEATETIVPE